MLECGCKSAKPERELVDLLAVAFYWEALACSSHTCQGTDSGLALAISKNPSEGSSGANQGVGGDNVFSKSDCFVLQRLLDNRMARGYNLRGTSLQGKQTKKERRARKNLPVRKRGPS